MSSGLIGSDGPLVQVYDLVLLDLDGVVYIGPAAVPGAAEALDRVRAAGVRTAFVTNNASRPPSTVAAHLRELGVQAEDSDVVNSAQAAAALLSRRLPPGAPVLVVGGEGLYRALAAVGLKPVADMDDEPVAVVQGFSPDLNWRLLAEGTRAVRSGLPWIATNTDLTVPTPHGPAPGNGTMVAAVAAATGAQPEVAGKPQPTLFLEAVERFGSSRPLVVGDRLDTDLEGARAATMDGLIVLTGVHRVRDVLAAPANSRPALIARDLNGLLEAHPAPQPAESGGWTVRGATVRVQAASPTTSAPVLEIVEPGGDALDLFRAGCAAAWEHADRPAGGLADGPADRPAGADLGDSRELDPAPLLTALYRLEESGPWGR